MAMVSGVHKKGRAVALLAMGWGFMAASLLQAQSMGTGTIQGTVNDPSGAPVSRASVTALDKTRGTQRNALTDSSGGYVFANMSIGDYNISVESVGFKKLVHETVHLNTDSTTTVNVTLQLGTAQESVTVSAAPPPLQTENGELGTLISGAQVSELSLNGRNFSQFLTLSPGVASSQIDRRMGVAQEGNPLMSINGGRVNSTRFTYDGVLAWISAAIVV